MREDSIKQIFILSVWVVSRLSASIVAITNPPPLLVELYAPFTMAFLESPSLDPWSRWFEMNGNPEAFPYSWPLLLFMTLAVWLGVFASSQAAGWLMATLILDLLILRGIGLLSEGNERSYLPRLLWAISPTPIVGIALLGSLDFLPGLLILSSLVALKRRRFWLVGFLVAAAISSKVLIGVAAFALFSYLFRSTYTSRQSTPVLTSTFLWGIIFSAPLLYSDGLRRAFFESPAASGPLTWGLGSQDVSIYLWPLAVLAVWYATWKLRRYSFDLLHISFAVPLVLTAALPGSAPGWTIWSLPIVLPLLLKLPRRYLFLGFSCLNFASIGYLVTHSYSFSGERLSAVEDSILATVVLTSSLLFIFLAWRKLVTNSDFHRLHSRPALVLIAGDSGVGKDTLSDGLTRALGEQSTIRISGDDYHLWDRGQGAWDYVTHLNPQANDLASFFENVLKLSSGEPIRFGKYDHAIGRRLVSGTAQSKEFIVVSGLHALVSGEVNSQALLRVYLEMSDELREELKMTRDSNERLQSRETVRASIQRRQPDAKLYIYPQASNSDVNFRVSRIANASGEFDQEISFDSEAKLFDNRLISELSITCNLDVSLVRSIGTRRTIVVRGEPEAGSLDAAFERLEPRVSRVLELAEPWSPGSPGIIQFVSLVYLANALKIERLL